MAKEKPRDAEAVERRRKVNERAMLQIDALREKRELSINKMCADGGVSAQAWFKWAKGESSPSLENVDKLVAGLKGRFLVVVQDGAHPVTAASVPPAAGLGEIGDEDDATKRILALLRFVSPEIRERMLTAVEAVIVETLPIRNPPMRDDGGRTKTPARKKAG
jgi:transcriptional regulator with XRE-family HTH domain